MSDTILIQRVLPHYRVELFQKLYDTYGVRTMTAARPPQNLYLDLKDPRDYAFAIPAPFRFPFAENPYAAYVPVGWMMKQFRPRRVVAEFGMRMTSSYELAARRQCGNLERLAFWSHGRQMQRGERAFIDRAIQSARLPLYSAADVIATYTQSGADWVAGHLPSSSVISLENALDTDRILAAKHNAKPAKHGSPQLLAVGRLTPEKRFEDLFEIVDIVSAQFPDVGLTIIGDGPEKARLMALAKDRCGKAIRFTGAIYDENELAPHFVGADLLVIPGSAGLVINHAQAYGLPVVAFAPSEAGPRHFPEISYLQEGESGILVGSAGAPAMAATIVETYAPGGTKLSRPNWRSSM